MATFRSLATVSVTVACVSAFTASSAFAAISYDEDTTINADPGSQKSDITLTGSVKTLTLTQDVTRFQSLTFAGYGNALTLSSSLTSATVTIGSITFTNSGVINIASSKTLNITGAFNGDNGKTLAINGAGDINFQGTNGFVGDISMNSSGTLSLTNAITARFIGQTSGTVNLS
ncbi:MAG: hypothetical protein RSB88_03975, partial [Akkermansia sp.]